MLVGRLLIGSVAPVLPLVATAARLLLLMLLMPLLTKGRLIWIVVGMVRVTVLFGDEFGLPNIPEEEPLVRVGVGVVEGDTEYRLGNSRRLPGTYGSILIEIVFNFFDLLLP